MISDYFVTIQKNLGFFQPTSAVLNIKLNIVFFEKI